MARTKGGRRARLKRHSHELPPRCHICDLNQKRHGYHRHMRYCEHADLVKRKAQKAASIKGDRNVVEERRHVPSPSSLLLGTTGGPSQLPVDAPLAETFDEQTRLPSPPAEPADTNRTSQRYLKVIHHKHAAIESEVIPLDAPLPALPSQSTAPQKRKPFAPFRTLADFEFVEHVVNAKLSRPETKELLDEVTNRWIPADTKAFLEAHGRSATSVTYRTLADVEQSMKNARQYTIQFRESTVSATLRGEERTFRLIYRDLWEFIVAIAEDPTLSNDIMWHSVTKTMHDENGEQPIIDQPNTASNWRDVDDKLPDADPYPHCWVPIHVWLDEGRVSRNVTKYPILVRLLSLPDWIRNASGNGGSLLVGYMLADIEASIGAEDDEELAHFIREIYQQVLYAIFASCRRRSHSGDVVRCGDGILRALHPGLGMASMDGKEAARFTGCKSHNANFPCPKCLVHKLDLDDITTTKYRNRTTKRMKIILADAQAAPSATARAEILKNNGLHNVKHFAWDMAFSDPYRALSYDTLHSDDLGKWGDHLWELLLKVVATIEDGPRRLNEYMRSFPRWQDFKHFINSILPCVTQILPSNSVLVKCIRAYLKYRMMIGMTCMTERRLQLVRQYVQEYQHCCEQVSKAYHKNFKFYKQHFTCHAERDIREKGTLNHACTRPGEGFIQEAAEAYSQTSKKNVDPQMTRIDENKEAVAQIRMTINLDKAARNEEEASKAASERTNEPNETDDEGDTPWALGSPSSGVVPSHQIEANRRDDPVYHDFDMRLRLFLLEVFPDEPLHSHDLLKTQVFQLAYVHYQSREDWRELRDMVRCNPCFFGEARYDCILLDYNTADLSFGRLQSLIRVELPSGRRVELAMVHPFTRSTWKPRTQWDGARIYSESRNIEFVLMDYVVRGALLAPAFGQSRKELHYLVDALDSDMFLRTIDDTI
ncbi:hypothetical protein FB107DRAFT_275798 [Schizophyllum commune]